MPWALPPLLAALLALLPSACGQTFGSSNVITVPTVAYISFAVVGFVLLLIMLLLKYRASTWRRREEERQAEQQRAEREAAEKAAWEAAHALREVHIPPVVLNPDCSLGLAEPDQQLPKDADAATGDWEQQQRQQQQQQVAQQQGQRQAARQQSQRSQRTTLGRPSGGVELQQLPPTVLHSAPQQPGGQAWPGATVYVRGSRAAFASASIQAPLV